MAIPKPQFVGSTELTWPVGTHDGPTLYLDDIMPAVKVDKSIAKATLADIIRDGYTLFSAGVLQTAGLPFDPVAACWSEEGLPMSEAPILIELQVSMLRGLASPLDRYVFGVRGEYAEKLFRYLDRMSIVAGGDSYEVARWRLFMLDVIKVSKMTTKTAIPPIVPIQLYGLVSSSEVIAWKQPTDPWTQPCLLTRKPLTQTQQKPKKSE